MQSVTVEESALVLCHSYVHSETYAAGGKRIAIYPYRSVKGGVLGYTPLDLTRMRIMSPLLTILLAIDRSLYGRRLEMRFPKSKGVIRSLHSTLKVQDVSTTVVARDLQGELL